MQVRAVAAVPMKPRAPAPSHDPGSGAAFEGDAAGAGLPTVYMSRAELEAAASKLAPPPPSPKDELVAIAPELVAWCADKDVQGALRALVGDGLKQISPVAGQVYDGAFLVLAAKPMVERWLDPAKDDPWELLLDTTTWVSKLAGLLSDVVPGLSPYKPHLATIGFACSVAGTVYKGRALLSTGAEQQLVDRVQSAIVGKLAPSPAVLALTLANATGRLPPLGAVPLGIAPVGKPK
jgi:hypothetical protein